MQPVKLSSAYIRAVNGKPDYEPRRQWNKRKAAINALEAGAVIFVIGVLAAIGTIWFGSW